MVHCWRAQGLLLDQVDLWPIRGASWELEPLATGMVDYQICLLLQLRVQWWWFEHFQGVLLGKVSGLTEY